MRHDLRVDEWSLNGYTSLRELGRGGFGRVVLARHDASGTHVAIKYLHVPDEKFRSEFRAEAGILRGLRDPHVVRLFDYVETPQGAAIVMEAIDGVSLRALLHERGSLEPEAALAVLKGSLLGLGAAHRVGVVHRDYKPANVMVGGDGQSKLIDFGIALRSGDSGQIVGTPPYMAPEQWAGAPASPSTDVYAATCVFFECVTGRTPYRADTVAAYRAQHTTGPIPSDQVPEPVRGLVERGLAKHPQGRPPGALEFAAELEQAATAAYGPEWESRGWRRLAEAAAGLAALFPFAMLVAKVAPGGGGHAGAAAGNAGHGVLTKLLGGNVATKVVAVATGAIVVGGAGAAAIVLTHHKPKKAAVAPLRVELASYNRQVTGLDLRGARYVRVTGGKDDALRRRVNAALAAPLEWAVDEMRQETAEAQPPCTQPTVLGSKPEIGLRGPHLVTVRYELPKQFCHPLDFELPHVTVTVDLRTGRSLTGEEVFAAGTATTSGIDRLMRRVKPHTTDPNLALVCTGATAPKDFRPGEPLNTKQPQPPRVSPFLTPKGLDVTWSHVGSECPFYAVTLPYSEARDLLAPKIVAELPK
jgi:serine/threonine-protein kinase